MLQNEVNISNNALTLLSANSTWVLARHQWLVDNMRSILMGEEQPTQINLPQFDDVVPQIRDFPENLSRHFDLIKITLEQMWKEITSANHPVSGLTMFEQLDNFQKLSHQFMAYTQEAHHELWEECAARDFLTGAWSRLKLHPCLNQAISNAKKNNSISSIALLDQNEFKLINDKWGHITGDRVLKETAALIEKHIRPKDKLFRFGGDEWLVLMPGTKVALANATMQRVAQLFETHNFTSQTGASFKSTFAIGITETANHKTATDWIESADAKLYSHKNQLKKSSLHSIRKIDNR